jgi:uroporphyrinogen decarboxylase
MQTFFGNLALRRDFAQALLVRITERCKAHMDNFLKALAGNVDVVMIGDDLGTQESLLISPQMYRGVLKPIHADWIAFIKARTTAKIFFHSDGDISPLIEDLIEIGVDILNPIQTSAGQMADLAMLKRRFGKRLCFCGALDTQHILPHGSPSDVHDEVQRVVGMLGTGGGYLLAAVHTIMPDVPPENILAMAAAVELHGRYPLSG